MKWKANSLFLFLLLISGCNSPTKIPTQDKQAKSPAPTQGLVTQTSPTSPASTQSPATQSPLPSQTPESPYAPPALVFPDFPMDLLLDELPPECPGLGHRAYAEPSIAPVLELQQAEQSVVLDRGLHITVTSHSDEVNGDTDSRDALHENPGPDGISLREALLVTNNDPDEYTILFTSSLKGTTIQVGSWNHAELPPLAGGSVILDGDIDGDLVPDITLDNQIGELGENAAIFGLRIHSSHNTISGLAFSGFTVGVLFDAPSSHQLYTDNSISHLFIEGESGIVLYSGQGSDDVTIPTTYNRWENTRVIGNTIVTHNGSGISFAMHRAAMDSVAYLTIAGNHIQAVNDVDRGRGNGIDIMPGYGAGSNGNRAEHVLIQDNTIEGNPGSAISLACGFMSAEANAIEDAYILGNTIRQSYTYAEYLHTFGISITAGFWITHEGNRISDLVIAGNTLEGNPEISVLISSGAVGSSKNLVERVHFRDNHIQVTRPAREDGIPIGAVAITTGDGATDYSDPDHQPVVYPNDNVLRDVWFSSNLIEGQGGSGIMISTGDPGVERNRVERIYIVGNEFEQFFPDMGVLVTAISLEHGGSGENHISEVIIQQNTIHYTNLRETFVGEEFVSGGIVLSAGNGASGNSTEDIWLVANYISSPAPGINLVAGWAQPNFPPSVGNRIRGVRLWCNTVAENPDLLASLFPGIRGINLAGGWGLAQDNLVEAISVERNLVAGIEDDISIFDDAGDGSERNSVSWP